MKFNIKTNTALLYSVNQQPTFGEFPPVSNEDQGVRSDVDGVENEGKKKCGEEQASPHLALLGLELPVGLGDALDGPGLLEDDGGLCGGLELTSETSHQLELVRLMGQVADAVNFNFFSEHKQLLLLKLRSLESHHVEQGLVVLVAAVDEPLEELVVLVTEL